MSRLAGLKKVIKRKGYAFVADALGYRDTNAIKKWIKRKRVPRIAQDRVDTFLTQEGY